MEGGGAIFVFEGANLEYNSIMIYIVKILSTIMLLLNHSPFFILKLDGVAPLITDPPTTRFTTFLGKKEEKNVICDM